MTTRRAKRGAIESVFWKGFGGGLGEHIHDPDGNGYAIATNCDTRWNDLQPGPLEVADMTGIAAGYYVVDWLKHNDVNIAVTTNGTNTIVYREETSVWATKATFNGIAAGPHCLLSFHDGTNSTLVVFLGAATAFQYTVDDGTNWTASTRTGNTKYGNMGIVRQNARTSADVLYVRSPNQIYTSTSMVNGGAAADTGSTIGDGSAQTYFNSVVEDDTGVIIFGMRHAAWSMDSTGAIYRLCEDVPDPPADAGGTSDRRNFESFAVRGARIYFIVGGYELWEYYHGVWNKEAAPWHQAERNGGEIPRAHLPLNAVTVAGEWIVLAMGLKTTTQRSFSFSEGGTTLLQNTLVATSELYAMAPRETEGGYVMVWHGSLLTCTDPLRFMWFDEDDSYLYLASGDAESINLQQKRCFFATSDPLTTASASTVTLNNGTVTVETGLLSAEYPFDVVRPISLKCVARGLTSSVTLAVRTRFVPENDTSTAYVTRETFSNGQRALYGTRFPEVESFRTGRIQFQLSSGGSGNNYGALRSAELLLAPFSEAKLSSMSY